MFDPRSLGSPSGNSGTEWNPSLPSCSELLETSAEEVAHVALDLGGGRFPAGLQQLAVLFGEHTGDDRPGMVPLVDELFEDAGVGVLRRHAESEQIEAHPGHLFNDGG